VIAVDTSVLLAAVNRRVPEHARASALLEALAEGDTPWALPWPAVHAFLATVTHPHRVARPLAAADAWGFLEALAASPALRLLGPTERHATVAAEVLRWLGEPRAPLGHAFELAVVLREHGVRELLSASPEPRRFGFLSVTDPFRGEGWSPGTAPRRRYRALPRGARR
jgi:predicted nucleic acid-binding protein